MLEVAFSFRGRLQRLPFLLIGLASSLVMVVGLVAIGLALIAAAAHHSLVGLLVFGIAFLALIVAALWCNLSLHVRRIRDIGWNPAIVIVSWIIFDCVDAFLLVRLLPMLAVGHGQHGTILGLSVNTGLMVTLLLMPGSDDDGAQWMRADRGVPPTPAGSAAPRPASAGGPKAFGRRGLV